MSDRLKGKFALITAAGQGIGRATAKAFARENARVLATDVNGDALDSLQREQPKLDIAQLDVCDVAAISKLAERVGAVDVLFNCAGMVHHGTILDCTEDDWRRSFELNVTSMYRMLRALLPAMLTARRGVSGIGIVQRPAPRSCSAGWMRR